MHLAGQVASDVEDLPCLDDIPLNAATFDTTELITKVAYMIGVCDPFSYTQLNNLSMQEEISALLDEDKYSAIVNSSGWPMHVSITVTVCQWADPGTQSGEGVFGLLH